MGTLYYRNNQRHCCREKMFAGVHNVGIRLDLLTPTGLDSLTKLSEISLLKRRFGPFFNRLCKKKRSFFVHRAFLMGKIIIIFRQFVF